MLPLGQNGNIQIIQQNSSSNMSLAAGAQEQGPEGRALGAVDWRVQNELLARQYSEIQRLMSQMRIEEPSTDSNMRHDYFDGSQRLLEPVDEANSTI